MKPIKCLVYKPACEFYNELLNFATNSRTSQRSSESYSEMLPEIDCKKKRLFVLGHRWKPEELHAAMAKWLNDVTLTVLLCCG